MHIQKNFIVNGSNGKPMATDTFYLHTSERKPVVIYAHGFNGFKDWANFDLIAMQFASAGFVFVKFNFSHNGTTPQQPEEFVDLDAYGNNNYTKELEDLGHIINWVSDADNEHAKQINVKQLFVIGHSMGGGISLLRAAIDNRVKAVATWASISACKTPWTNWNEEKIKQWKEQGVAYTLNSRTKQDLPLNYQLYLDYQNNKQALNIEQAVKGLQIPLLICHGLADTSVPIDSAYQMHKWHPKADLFLVNSDHVFGRKHPWTDAILPDPMQQVVDKTISFFGSCL